MTTIDNKYRHQKHIYRLVILERLNKALEIFKKEEPNLILKYDTLKINSFKHILGLIEENINESPTNETMYLELNVDEDVRELALNFEINIDELDNTTLESIERNIDLEEYQRTRQQLLERLDTLYRDITYNVSNRLKENPDYFIDDTYKDSKPNRQTYYVIKEVYKRRDILTNKELERAYVFMERSLTEDSLRWDNIDERNIQCQ